MSRALWLVVTFAPRSRASRPSSAGIDRELPVPMMGMLARGAEPFAIVMLAASRIVVVLDRRSALGTLGPRRWCSPGWRRC